MRPSYGMRTHMMGIVAGVATFGVTVPMQGQGWKLSRH